MTDIDRVLRSNLKLKHLQLIVALDEFRHLGRASEFLSLTQPAVSKSLAEVERMFGLELFTRSTRGTEPTPYGATVIRFARSVLADFGRTRDEIAAVAGGASERVRVGAMVVATPGLLTGAVARVKAQSARTTVSIEEGDLTRLMPRLRVGELDLIVGRLEPGYAAPDIATEPLYDEPMCVIAPPDHPLATADRPAWADVAALPWVVPPAWASSRVKLLQLFYKHGLQPPADVIETASFLMTITFVRQRPACGFVARGVALHLEREGLARRVNLNVPIELPPVGIITLRAGLDTPPALRMREALRQEAAHLAPPGKKAGSGRRRRA